MPDELSAEADPRSVDDLIEQMLMMSQLQQQVRDLPRNMPPQPEGNALSAGAMPRMPPPQPDYEQNWIDLNQAFKRNQRLRPEQSVREYLKWQGHPEHAPGFGPSQGEGGNLPVPYNVEREIQQGSPRMRTPNLRRGRPNFDMEHYQDWSGDPFRPDDEKEDI